MCWRSSLCWILMAETRRPLETKPGPVHGILYLSDLYKDRISTALSRFLISTREWTGQCAVGFSRWWLLWEWVYNRRSPGLFSSPSNGLEFYNKPLHEEASTCGLSPFNPGVNVIKTVTRIHASVLMCNSLWKLCQPCTRFLSRSSAIW